MYTQLNKKTSWANEQDYILGSGEPGYDIKERVLKIGNGESKWKELSPALSLSVNEFYNGENTKEDVGTIFEKDIIAKVTYQGQTIETLFAGQKVILLTKGDRAIDDIQIETNMDACSSEVYDGSVTKGVM